MTPKYEIGQKVRIRPVSGQPVSARDCDLGAYAGHTGEVYRYYWLSPRTGTVFYIYIVLVGDDRKELVLHEDEIEACVG